MARFEVLALVPPNRSAKFQEGHSRTDRAEGFRIRNKRTSCFGRCFVLMDHVFGVWEICWTLGAGAGIKQTQFRK